MENVVKESVTKIMNAPQTTRRKAERIVSQMEWYPGVSDTETWRDIIELVIEMAELGKEG